MPELRRQLSTRHLSMIALGGSLGTGIFLASGSALHYAGPAGAVLAYLIMGAIVYLLMSGLGEMSAYRPIAGSFCQYASDYVGKSFGFAMGYNYWFNWAITIAIELVAAAVIMQYWFPNVSPVYWCALFFMAIFILNILPVRHYGESQYWLSLMKVLAIVAFILICGAIVFVVHGAKETAINNWSPSHGAFHGGFSGLFEVFLLSGFAFQGTELIGVTAGEADQPQKSIPKAIRQVFWRILIFYVLTMFMISLLIPYTDPNLLNPNHNVAMSPFTLVLSQIGLHHIAGIMNVVILVALLSACNSDMYSATRILWHLSTQGSAPQLFKRINAMGIPIFALIFTAAFGLLALLTNYFGSNQLFLWLVNISSLCGFVAWVAIAVSHYRFRQVFLAQGGKLSDLPYRSWSYPWGPLLALAVCLIIIVGQGYLLLANNALGAKSLLATYIDIPLVLILWFGHRLYRRYRQNKEGKSA